jgi:hypothetical protein
MSFAPISFSPVWFSTDQQLAALVQVFESATLTAKLLGRFDLPFTRVRTSKPSPIDDFLLCVGGKIAIPRIRSRSRELRASLVSWHAVSNQGAMQ